MVTWLPSSLILFVQCLVCHLCHGPASKQVPFLVPWTPTPFIRLSPLSLQSECLLQPTLCQITSCSDDWPLNCWKPTVGSPSIFVQIPPDPAQSQILYFIHLSEILSLEHQHCSDSYSSAFLIFFRSQYLNLGYHNVLFLFSCFVHIILNWNTLKEKVGKGSIYLL
jgi:hypothetical protein